MEKIRKMLSRLANNGNTALALLIVLGAIFIAAGAGKLIGGNQFLPLAGYQFLPQNVASFLDLILPWTEITLGALLLCGYFRRFVGYTSILFIAAFIGANSYSLLMGNTAPCQCFGGLFPLTHWQSLVIDIVMLLIASWLVISKTQPSLDQFRLKTGSGVFSFSSALLLTIIMIAVSFPANVYASAPDPGTTATYGTMKFNSDQQARREAAFRGAPSISLGSSGSRFQSTSTVALPTSYSLLPDLQYTPSQRNQGSVGNCWVWAGTGLMEIALDVNNSIKDRLSIQYFDSNYTGGWAGCGGWLGDFVSFYNSPATAKAIPWSNSNANYQDASRGGCPNTPSVSAGSIVTTPNYPTTNSLQAVTVPTTGIGIDQAAAIANIQATLLQNKAIEFDYELPTAADWDNFFIYWATQPETAIWTPNSSYGNADSGDAGHAVLCVGYDMTDPNNPYWVMLNSWGTTSGRPNGLFRVSMNMNYNTTFRSSNHVYQSFWWSTLNNVFVPPPTPGPAAKLAFTTQPSVVNTAGVVFGTQPVVKVQDASGNTVTTSNAAVTLAITRETGASGAALSGTATVNAVNGVATFNGLSINLAGTGYTLTAASSGLTSAASTSFDVSTAPAALILSSPADGANVAGNSVTCTWSSIPNGVWYEIQLSPNSGFTSLYTYMGGNFTTFTSNNLPHNGSTVYWRVRASDGVWSGWSSPRSFVNGQITPVAPALVTPADGANVAGNSVTCSWSTITGGVWYEIQLSPNSGFTSLYTYMGGNFTTFTSNNLPNNGSTVYWRVRASNGVWSGWSSPRSFVNGQITPVAPALSTPADGANVAGNSVTCSWSTITGGVWYEIQLSSNSGFTSLYTYMGGNFTTFTSNNLPNNGSTVYWRVRASNGVWSGWSSPRSFVNGQITPVAPALVTPADGANVAGNSVTCSWSTITGGVWYEIQLSPNSGFTSLYTYMGGNFTTFTSNNLPHNGSTVYWRVRASNGVWSGWSSPRRFVNNP